MSRHGLACGGRAGGTPPSAVQEETQTSETVPRSAAFVAFASFFSPPFLFSLTFGLSLR